MTENENNEATELLTLRSCLEIVLEGAIDKFGASETLDLLREALEGRCVAIFGCNHTADDCQCGEGESHDM